MTEENRQFDEWIGKTDQPPADILTPRLLSEFKATFAAILPAEQETPLGIHWCLFPPAVAESGLGLDGHPAKGGFLPPIPLPRRMWAGGEIDFTAEIEPGDTVEKRSEIVSVERKEGRSGELHFVTVAHAYEVNGKAAIRERQSIVYRAAATKMLPKEAPNPARPRYYSEQTFPISPVTLFRYSALTFNAHKIHYDLQYAQEQKFYRDLVIHGPLQATALLNFAKAVGKQTPRHFAYRGLAPATGAQTLTLGAGRMSDGTCNLVVLNEASYKTMEARAEW